MSGKGSCRTCPLVSKITKKASEKPFVSKNTLNKLHLNVLKIKDEEDSSFYDLKNQISKDYPCLNKAVVCIPSSPLLTYPKEVPYFVTEVDSRLLLQETLEEILKTKNEVLQTGDTLEKVDDIFNRFKEGKVSEHEASSELNSFLLETIFIEDKQIEETCKMCSKEDCKEPCCCAKKLSLCKLEKLKDTYRKWIWPQKLKSSTNGQDIILFAKSELAKK